MKQIVSCHCKNIVLEFESEQKEAISCNCSICLKKGALLIFVPESQAKIIKQEEMGDYQFGKKHIHHHFCKICAVSPFGRGNMPDGTPIFSINIRCIDDVDLGTFTIKEFDGKNL